MVYDKDKNPVRVEGVMRDITRRKKAEEKSKYNENRYQTIFNSAPIGIMIEDEKGNIIEVNEVMSEDSGYSKAELEGSSVLDKFVLPEYQELAKENIKRLLQGEDLEFDIKTPTTDLYNRKFFEEELERLDTKRQLPLSIIMGDLNGLKIINDSYGQKKGNHLLIKTAKILKEVVRNEDIIARYGGDEFTILLPKTTNKTAKKFHI